MIKFDVDYKKNITIKSNKKEDFISFNNKTKDNVDYPYWLSINDKELNLSKLLLNKTINFADTIKNVYFFYKNNKIYASSALTENFLNNLSGNLYKGTFSNSNFYNSIKTNKEDMFFNIEYLIYCYSQEELIVKNCYKNKCEIISNIENPLQMLFLKFNDKIMEEKEYTLLEKNLPKDSIYSKELLHYKDYLKAPQNIIFEQKILLLNLHQQFNNIILKNQQKLINLSKKYKKKFKAPFIPYLYLYPDNNIIKRQKEILKYYPITELDYTIFNYINFKPLLLKNNQIVSVPLNNEEYDNNINSFTESALNFLLKYCCYNIDCFKEVFYTIIEILETELNMVFNYTLILPIQKEDNN